MNLAELLRRIDDLTGVAKALYMNCQHDLFQLMTLEELEGMHGELSHAISQLRQFELDLYAAKGAREGTIA